MVGWGLVVVVLGGPPLLVGGRAPAPSVTAGRPSLACRGHIQGACAVRKNKQVIKNEEFSLMIEISITFGSFTKQIIQTFGQFKGVFKHG